MSADVKTITERLHGILTLAVAKKFRAARTGSYASGDWIKAASSEVADFMLDMIAQSTPDEIEQIKKDRQKTDA